MHDIEKNDADGSELLEDPAPHEPCFHPTHTKDWELSGEHLFFSYIILHVTQSFLTALVASSTLTKQST